MFGRAACSGGCWTSAIFLIIVVLLNSTVNAAPLPDCVKVSETGVVTITGNCPSTVVTLEVAAEDVEFALKYTDNVQTKYTNTKLKVGSCSVEGEISAGAKVGPLWTFSGDSIFFLFPINGKITANQLNLNSGGNTKTIQCEEPFKKTKSGSLLVPIELTTTHPLPALNIVINKAKIHEGEVDEWNGWGIYGWKLWTSIGSAVVVFAIVVICLVIWWWKKKQNGAERQAAVPNKNNKKEPAEPKKSLTKSVEAAPALGETTALMVKADQGGELKTTKSGTAANVPVVQPVSQTPEGDKMKTAEEKNPYEGVNWSWPTRQIPDNTLQQLCEILGHATEKDIWFFLQKFPLIAPHKVLALLKCIDDYVHASKAKDFAPESREVMELLKLIKTVHDNMHENPGWRPSQ